MKKLTMMLCMAMVLMMSVTMVSAAENIEIVFCVGDSTLSINGNDVTVEIPYVVDGTTLVPVRVITEAFGAEVGWVDETRTVTIEYSDVTISLSIDSDKAYINGTETTLLAAPELTNSTTMVPLRFITETFGADVSYNEATEGITVVKEMTESNSIKDYSLILKRSTKEYVGDSYLGWSMKRSPALKLVERSFDGWNNIFSDSNTGATMRIKKLVNFEGDDQLTVDDVLSNMRETSSNYTTSRLDKTKTPQGYDCATLAYRTSSQYKEIKYILRGEEVYSIDTTMDISQNQKDFNSLCQITETFDFVFVSTKTEDLSDVNTSTNMHTFKSDFMGLEMDIPGYLMESSSDNLLNGAYFYELNNSNAELNDSVGIRMYSIVGEKNSKYWANEDRTYNIAKTSDKFFTYQPVKSMTVAEKYAWYYTNEYKYNGKTYITYDVFIDNESYFYNLYLTFEQSKAATIDKILASVKLKEVDKEETGNLLRSDSSESSYKDYSIDSTNITFKGPDNDWTPYKQNGSIALYSSYGTAIINCEPKSNYQSYINSFTIGQMITESLRTNPDVSDVSSTPKHLKDCTYTTYEITYKQKSEDLIYNNYCYIIDDGTYYIIYEYYTPEPHDGQYSNEVRKTMLDSLTNNK